MSIDGYVHLLHRGHAGQPILFVFHGTGGDENQFFGYARRALPEATIVAPRGDVSESGALRFFRRTGEGVYDMDDLARRTEAMTSFVRAHVAEAGPAPVIGLGYSNGANILAAMMLAEGGLFDGAALMHPLIPWTPKDNPALRNARLLITAGAHDPICPKKQTQALIDYFRRQKAEVATEWHEGGHEIRETEIAAVGAFLADFARK